MTAFQQFRAVNKDIKSKKKFGGNYVHNILRLFHGLANFPFILNFKVQFKETGRVLDSSGDVSER